MDGAGGGCAAAVRVGFQQSQLGCRGEAPDSSQPHANRQNPSFTVDNRPNSPLPHLSPHFIRVDPPTPTALSALLFRPSCTHPGTASGSMSKEDVPVLKEYERLRAGTSSVLMALLQAPKACFVRDLLDT
ncbi:hypothetical protein AAFF_G00023220 [Aldrovandia affinis]|uniref:Uncharacterized protein n=1 Tax=Aldrovandia affinis TaxID=143900 RepID=A0AAD7T5G6_9TELE|nr:hypothetical protein AAFF_G00023220 [Aldrovandia affinis]